MKNRILTFFVLSFTLLFIVNCNQTALAPNNPTPPYPKIIYDKTLDTSIIPTDFSKTLDNRIKILFSQNPNPKIQAIHYHFIHFYNESQGDRSPSISFGAYPRYLIQLNLKVITQDTTSFYKQNYEIPIALFNPMYDQHFDSLISKALKTP